MIKGGLFAVAAAQILPASQGPPVRSFVRDPDGFSECNRVRQIFAQHIIFGAVSTIIWPTAICLIAEHNADSKGITLTLLIMGLSVIANWAFHIFLTHHSLQA